MTGLADDARTVRLGDVEVVLLDDVAGIAREHAGRVVVTGSHGGLGNAARALRFPPRLIAFHDAGVGKDEAGVAGLERLGGLGIPALAVAAASARIGDADDVLAHGEVSRVNAAARALGAEPGRRLAELIEALPLG